MGTFLARTTTTDLAVADVLPAADGVSMGAAVRDAASATSASATLPSTATTVMHRGIRQRVKLLRAHSEGSDEAEAEATGSCSAAEATGSCSATVAEGSTERQY